VFVYRTRVPAWAWYNPESRAVLLERLEHDERRPIGYDESLAQEGVVLLISVGDDRLDRPLPARYCWGKEADMDEICPHCGKRVQHTSVSTTWSREGGRPAEPQRPPLEPDESWCHCQDDE